jgi:hypothetical protein
VRLFPSEFWKVRSAISIFNYKAEIPWPPGGV